MILGMQRSGPCLIKEWTLQTKQRKRQKEEQSTLDKGTVQWFQSTWHNPQKVVYLDPHTKDIFAFVPSILQALVY